MLKGHYDINRNEFKLDNNVFHFKHTKNNKLHKTDERMANEGLWDVECRKANIEVILFDNRKENKNDKVLKKNGSCKFFVKGQEIYAKPMLKAILSSFGVKIKKKDITRQLAKILFGEDYDNEI